MDVEQLKQCVRKADYFYSAHAEFERRAANLTASQIAEALLQGQILEQYPDTGRGVSCLLVGFAGDVPIHVVCGWRGSHLVLITVYIPELPKFVDPWTRSKENAGEAL